ncbi:MAG TPA: DUF748 domain-containing protein [Verrucomicrobiae bacterium]|nr:DUF748 domain-containing protein [Verrucomicrobiae bacterium]
MSNLWNSLSARRRKIIKWIFWLLVIYGVVGFLILPPIVRHVAVKELSAQLDREVSIQKIKINPFAFSVTVRGLLVKDKDGQPFISWDEVYVNFQLSSFFRKAWTFSKISTTKLFVRAQMNKDHTFNFSDLITKFSTNAPDTVPKSAAKPLFLRIGQLQVIGASASLTDMTLRHPFTRTIGPIDLTLNNFQTDPNNKNPYAFAGTTDAGDKFSWSGTFSLEPLRSQGELSIENFLLTKYAPLYQDFVNFEIRSGEIGIVADYRFELNESNRVATVTNLTFELHDFTLGEPGKSNNIVELPYFGVTNASVDVQARQATVDSISSYGAKLFLQREKNNSFNVVEASKPVADASASGGILLLLRSVTNVVAELLNSTNQWSGTIHNINSTGGEVHLEDFANARPARLDLNDITFQAKNISNLPNTNLDAELSLRWNTNGSIKINTTASFLPTTADVKISLSNLDLGTLDPYLEPKVNLFILGSQLGLDDEIHLRTQPDGLPQVTFQGDARLDDFHTVDGVMGDDLLKWNSVQVNGINANLNPETIAIKEILLNDVNAHVVVETNHTINLLTALKPAETNAATETNSAVAAKNSKSETTNNLESLPKISVGNIIISNAQFTFSDRSLSPNVDLGVEQFGGTISDISSEELQHADVNLHALVDGVGPMNITGQINPFSGTQTNHLTISLKDMDLTPTGPYAAKFAGYDIAEGKLNLNLDYNIVGRKLKSKNVITLDRFTFGEKTDSPDATHLPVRLAIAILKDRDGKIVLDVPVEGSLDDPKFRVGQVVERAIVNILTKVATSPFSLLGAAFGGGGEELSYEDFAPGSAELMAADKEKLDSLVKGLYSRPALNLEISGSIDPVDDRDGLQRVAMEKELRTQKWQSLRKSARANTTADQITLTPEERTQWVKKLYGQALADGKITPALIAANTNLVAAAAQIPPRKSQMEKGATLLLKSKQPAESKTANTRTTTQLKSVTPTDPMEILLMATFAISDDDFKTLATDRAKAVRVYILQSGKVDVSRLFLTESKTGKANAKGSRVYLQFR